ncbi:MAG: response regulator [Gammaproteobacteria bacterium]|nr:response regulator [Gammaproteobacteria bacterium]
MADSNKNLVEEKLAALRESYYSSLPQKISDIQTTWDKVLADKDADMLKEFQHQVHTLSGSGATFGLEEISRISKEIDNAVTSLLSASSYPDSNTQKAISQLINDIALEVSNIIPQLDTTGVSQVNEQVNEDRPVYIVEDDVILGNKLKTELEAVNYHAQVFTELDSFKQAYQSNKPDAVIMDMVFPENEEGGARAMQTLMQMYRPTPPVIFISNRHDIKARLEAVRAGASRYFTKPLDTEKLIQTLSGVTNRLPHQPYRVMVVDDDKELAEYYGVLLHGAGILTKLIHQPLDTLEALEDWQPDLVIMDVYMPECNGLELASIIRQDDKFTTLPIVFLSSEQDINKQLYALDLGGDAFLTKPVDQQQLLSTVIARVKRSRWLIRLKTDLEMSLQKNESQRKEIEKKEERLRFSQYFAGIGTWDLNLTTQDMHWSEKIGPLLGYEKNKVSPSYDAFLAAVHPEDKQKLIKAMDSCATESRDYEIEHRIIWLDGSIRWLLQKGDVIRNAEGKPVRMLGAIQDTTRRKQLEKDLATQKEFAVQANSAKSEFLSRMSHELRTPLNAIIGFTQLLESDTEQPLLEHQHDSLNEILKASNHLLELIDEVLDLAKIEAGKVQLNIEETEVVDVLLESYSMMIPMAENQDITLEFDMDKCEKVGLSVDRTKLKQVMFNLISNAIKYNKANGKVCVTCEPKGTQRIRINVSDTGIGIPAERQSELFKAFNRLGAESTDVEGTGIGLMISKKIIEMMGGEMGFQSKPGTGSTFWLEMSTLSEIKSSDLGEDKLALP